MNETTKILPFRQPFTLDDPTRRQLLAAQDRQRAQQGLSSVQSGKKKAL